MTGTEVGDSLNTTFARVVARLRSIVSLFGFHTRQLFSWQTAALVAGLGLFLGVRLGQMNVSMPSDCLFTLYALETGVFVLLSMGLITRERDLGALEMTLVSSRGFHSLILIKFIPMAFWALAMGLCAALGLKWMIGGFGWGLALLFAYTTGMLFGMTAHYLSVMTRNAYMGAGGALLLAFFVYAYFAGKSHRALLDPFVQIFQKGPEELDWKVLSWNRFFVFAWMGVFYDQSIRRMRRIELWV